MTKHEDASMTTEIHLEDKLVKQGLALTGLNRPQELVELALQELVARRAPGTTENRGTDRRPGSARGKLRILSDDDEHLEDFGDLMV
jgi:Arc/MetJ family transcription regulator